MVEIMAEKLTESDLPSSFRNVIVATSPNIIIRSDINSFDDLKKWVKEFEHRNNMKWMTLQTISTASKYICRKIFVCHRSSYRKARTRLDIVKDVKCPAKLMVKVKKDTRNTRNKDPLIKIGLRGEVVIQNTHSHSLYTRDTLRLLPTDDSIKEMFLSYFNMGLGVAESRRYHEGVLLMTPGNTEESLINGRINPNKRTVHYWHKLWKNENSKINENIVKDKNTSKKLCDTTNDTPESANNIVIKEETMDLGFEIMKSEYMNLPESIIIKLEHSYSRSDDHSTENSFVYLKKQSDEHDTSQFDRISVKEIEHSLQDNVDKILSVKDVNSFTIENDFVPSDCDVSSAESDSSSNREKSSPESDSSNNREKSSLESDSSSNREKSSPESDSSNNREKSSPESDSSNNREQSSPESDSSNNREKSSPESDSSNNREQSSPESDFSNNREKSSPESDSSNNREQSSPESDSSNNREQSSPESDSSNNREKTSPESDSSNNREQSSPELDSSNNIEQESAEHDVRIHTENSKDDNKVAKHLLCEICGKRFNKKYGIRCHMSVHTGERIHKCNFCGASFKVRPGLHSHTLHMHRDLVTIYDCYICEKSFMSETNLSRHMVLHANIKSCVEERSRTLRALVRSPFVSYTCVVCGIIYRDRKLYNRHLRSHCENIKNCTACDKQYDTKQSMFEHLLTHSS